jgi:hypothetical protein
MVRTHLRFGWIGLLVYVILGIALEGLHAFKSPAYLGVGHETRRLMWTLAHAHGIGLSLVHIAFAATAFLIAHGVARLEATTTSVSVSVPKLELGSRLLGWASVLIPGGFFLGGVVTYEGDPGIGVLLVPIGAILLVIAIVRVVWTLAARPRE